MWTNARLFLKAAFVQTPASNLPCWNCHLASAQAYRTPRGHPSLPGTGPRRAIQYENQTQDHKPIFRFHLIVQNTSRSSLILTAGKRKRPCPYHPAQSSQAKLAQTLRVEANGFTTSPTHRGNPDRSHALTLDELVLVVDNCWPKPFRLIVEC